jgi:hypothetical protein
MISAHLEPATDQEIKDLHDGIKSFRHWANMNFMVKDVYDTYPDEIWAAITTPDRIDRLLFRLHLAEQRTLSARLKRFGRAVADALARRF